MPLFDIFKKKKSGGKKVKLEEKELLKNKGPLKNLKKVKVERQVAKEKKDSKAYQFLKAPHITEKAGDLTEKNQYIFKIYPKASKMNVKEAIEDVFKVKVTSVKIINVLKKKRRLGKISGWRKGYKKAIVRIKKDQRIEVLPR